MKLTKKLFWAPVAAFALFVGIAQADSVEAVRERIKPVGVVCLKGQDCTDLHSSSAVKSTVTEVVEEVVETPAGTEAAAVEVTASSARSGEQIVAQFCATCHATGLLDAPKTGDAAAWKTRSDAAGGLKGLVDVAKAGKGAMPPMGICNDCSDVEMEAAISYMSGL